jgi:peptide/nickel transport system substrate-binding protein
VNRKISLLLALLLIALVLGACGAPAAAPTTPTTPSTPDNPSTTTEVANPALAKAQNILRLAISSDPRSINPLAPMGGGNGALLVYPTLVSLVGDVNDLSFENVLAESITSTDNQLYTIKIRNDVTWSDGEKITADTVIYTINAITNPLVGAGRVTNYFNLIEGTDGAGIRADGTKPLDSVKKIDDYTLTIQLKAPTTLDFFNLNIGIQVPAALPAHLLSEVPPEQLIDSPVLNEPTISAGAFLFKEYSPGEYWYFERNDKYFRGVPKLEGLQIKVLTMAQISAQLESGELDGNFPPQGYIPVEDYERVQALPYLNTYYLDPTNHGVLYINANVVDNAKARQAINVAIDRQLIIDQVFLGHGYPINVPMSKQVKYWNEAVATPEYNPEKAKQLLAESGWDATRELKFELQTGNAARERACLLIAEQLNAVGFKVTISLAEWADLNARLNIQEYDLAMFNAPDNPLDWQASAQSYAGTRGTTTGYSNPEADALLDKIRGTVDDAELRAQYYELEELFAEEVPVVGLWMDFPLGGVNKRVTTGELKQYGTLFDIEKWEVVTE